MENEPQSTVSIKRVLGTILVIVLIIILFLVFIDFELVIKEIQEANPIFLIGASLFFIMGLILYAIRWRVLLQQKPGAVFTFHTSNVGHAANMLLPLRAGEPLRILIMGTNADVSYTAATSSFVVERLFEQLMRILALTLALAFGLGLEISVGSMIGGLIIVIGGFGAIAWLARNQTFSLAYGTKLIAKIPKVSEEQAHHVISELLENLRGVSEPREFLAVMFWSIASWGLFGGFFYLTLLSLGDAFPLQDLLPISLGALALSPPSAPTQPGIFHASVVVPLAALGFDPDKLTAYAVLLHILELIWITILGFWGFIATGSSWRVISDLFKSKT